VNGPLSSGVRKPSNMGGMNPYKSPVLFISLPSFSSNPPGFQAVALTGLFVNKSADFFCNRQQPPDAFINFLMSTPAKSILLVNNTTNILFLNNANIYRFLWVMLTNTDFLITLTNERLCCNYS
jgi:hypothetical protein